MTFFATNQTEYRKGDMRAAEHLHGHLASKRCAGHVRPNFKKWANEFRLLRTKGSWSPSVVKKVLLWYCGNIKEPYVPHAFSAKQFRHKFPQILAAYERAAPITNPMTISIIDKLSGLTWPNGGDGNLPNAVAIAVGVVETFRVKALELKTQAEKDLHAEGRKRAIAQRLIRQIDDALQHVTPRHVVVTWFKKYNQQVVGWKEWGGSFKSFTANEIYELKTSSGWRTFVGEVYGQKD